MANFHSDEWVREQLEHHVDFARTLYNHDQIVGLFCQGSTNYGLDIENSDFDSKCIVVPTFKDIALVRKPVTITHVLPNNEHCNGKDVRLYMGEFRKQNLNFVEILFTKYFYVNPLYAEQWARLVEKREAIAHMNPCRAMKAMKGMALDKYHAMEHPYPSKIDLIEKHGHDGKQTHHLIRVDDFMTRFQAGEPYESCMYPSEHLLDEMQAYKRQEIPLEVARVRAKQVLDHVTKTVEEFCALRKEEEDEESRALLEDVSYNILKIAVEKELKR
jgi:hypothetical protein